MITAILTVASLAVGLFTQVKKNEAAADAAAEAVKKQAEANLKALYDAESDQIAKQQALTAEEARLRAEAEKRQVQFNNISIAAFAVVATGALWMAIKALRQQ